MIGFDTPEALPDLTNAGFDFVMKYISNTPNWPSKHLSHAERAMCVQAKVANFFIFEKSSDPAYFSQSQGAFDAQVTLQYFLEIGVPANAGIICFAAYDF